jgi:hypothetical protein
VNSKFLWLLPCVLAVFCPVEKLQAQGTAFTYQGRLVDGGGPANGLYDFTFQVFDAASAGSGQGGIVSTNGVGVTNGLFVAQLDFGSEIFTGLDRWLQIAVRTNGAATFTNLSPRQQLTPVPYAIFANTASNLSGSVTTTQLTGTLPASAFAGFTNAVALTNGANLFNGTFSGNGTNLFNLNASQLTGGTVADARLSTNVALLNTNQTFTGTNIFTGVVKSTGTNTFTGINTFTNLGNSFSGSFFGNGLVGWIATNGTAIQAQSDHGYLLTNSLLATVKLPATPAIGDIVRVSGAGAGGWGILQNINQSIIGNFFGFTNSSWLQSGAPSANWASIASSSDGTKLVAAVNGSGALYNSTDSGKTWVLTSPMSGVWEAVASSADGAKLAAAINGNVIYTSVNSGGSWIARPAATSEAWSSLASSADGMRLVAVVNGGGIYGSTDAGTNWTLQTTGSKSWFSVASSSDGTRLAAVMTGGGIYTNSGSIWTATGAPVKNWVSVASSADGSKLAAVETGGQIYTSVNSGATWTQQINAPALTWACIASSSDGGKLMAASQGGGIYNSINWGVTWTQQTGTTGKTWNCIASSAAGNTLAAGIFGGGIYYAQASVQTTTTTGTSGGIAGVQGSAVELQYIGNNQFMPLSSTGTIWAN